MTLHLKNRRETTRLYAAEGAVHLYSSLPTVLAPADLYRIRDDPKYESAIADCNVYVIASRPRIFIDSSEFSLSGMVLIGYFLVQRPGKWARIKFEYEITSDRIGEGAILEDVGVTLGGTHVVLITSAGQRPISSHVIVATARTNLQHSDRDLEVLYVGQAIGRSGKRNAVDRLLSHTTFQRILAESVTFWPEREILLLLYRFEHGKTLASTGGDMNADSTATDDEESRHFDRLCSVKLNRRAIVSLAEAGLIRHFQPLYNVQIKTNDFASKSKIAILKNLLSQDITGLIVEIGSSNVGSRLRSASATPRELSEFFDPEVLRGDRLESDALKLQWAQELYAMAHTHYAEFPLTTPEERDTFLHGTIWHGETRRSPS